MLREAEKQKKIKERLRRTLEREEKNKISRRNLKSRVTRLARAPQVRVDFKEKNYLVTNVLCFGAYQDDFDENCELVREWLQCASESSAKINGYIKIALHGIMMYTRVGHMWKLLLLVGSVFCTLFKYKSFIQLAECYDWM